MQMSPFLLSNLPSIFTDEQTKVLPLSQVVSNAVRQLQNLVTDEAAVECHELFLSESKSSATGGTCSTAYDRLIPELIYQKKAEKLLADENCMKIFIVSATFFQ